MLMLFGTHMKMSAMYPPHAPPPTEADLSKEFSAGTDKPQREDAEAEITTVFTSKYPHLTSPRGRGTY
jgi:hypothetical protein